VSLFSHPNALRFAAGDYSPTSSSTSSANASTTPPSDLDQQDALHQVYEPREANRYVYAGGDLVNLMDATTRA
jgi:hypothetical protein